MDYTWSMFREITEEMLEFIKGNPTAFHTVDSIKKELESQGFEGLLESRDWNLEPGRGYYVCRGGSSIIAFKLGKKPDNYSFNIAAVHTDSPAFKLKEKPLIRMGKEYTKLNTEGYGGMLCSTWFDRPLSIAGRVLVKNEDGAIVTRLLNIDRDLLLIPSVAIHMNRDANEGMKYNKQVDLLPLFGTDMEEDALVKLIAETLGTDKENIIGSDLYLYIRDKASVWGYNDEFVSSERLDDEQCVYAAMKAFLEGGNEQSVSVLACFDNEEVGSGTKQGAASTFLSDALRRINMGMGKTETDYMKALASSFMLSADNAHAVHPNHPEYTDAENNVYMNKGVVVKSHAGQKYTSDGLSIAVVKELASKANVPLQYFANRSDKIGGSTLGNIAMSQVSVNCVDIGLPQLAMHSGYETAGVKDTLYMINLMKQFYDSHFMECEYGVRIIGD